MAMLGTGIYGIKVMPVMAVLIISMMKTWLSLLAIRICFDL